jgi:hypothetical protein
MTLKIKRTIEVEDTFSVDDVLEYIATCKTIADIDSWKTNNRISHLLKDDFWNEWVVKFEKTQRSDNQYEVRYNLDQYDHKQPLSVGRSNGYTGWNYEGPNYMTDMKAVLKFVKELGFSFSIGDTITSYILGPYRFDLNTDTALRIPGYGVIMVLLLHMKGLESVV